MFFGDFAGKKKNIFAIFLPVFRHPENFKIGGGGG
jgi:hypothetical protein